MRRLHLLGAIAAVVTLAAGSTVALAAATNGFHSSDPGGSVGCTAPALPGTAIDVTLTDMSSMMGGNGQMGWRGWPNGALRATAVPGEAAHGPVSLRVTNAGGIAHELVVLPLDNRAAVGARSVGEDGRVDETSSLGEASRSCAAGTGEGIAAGAASWLTVTLVAGRYELLCNLPGHYGAGMFTELVIT